MLRFEGKRDFDYLSQFWRDLRVQLTKVGWHTLFHVQHIFGDTPAAEWFDATQQFE